MLKPSIDTAQAANRPIDSLQRAAPAVNRVRPSSFKYYIHDSTDALRLKLIGEFSAPDVTELNGCWRTAKTTIGKRKLILDLRGLVGVDDAAKQWLASMSAEGACYWPEDFLLACVAGQQTAPGAIAGPAQNLGVFGRLRSLFRGVRVSSAQSSTQEP